MSFNRGERCLFSFILRLIDFSYLQEIPQEELSASEPSDKIITVFHYTKDPQRTHGVPFRFVLHPVRGKALMQRGEKVGADLFFLFFFRMRSL